MMSSKRWFNRSLVKVACSPTFSTPDHAVILSVVYVVFFSNKLIAGIDTVVLFG